MEEIVIKELTQSDAHILHEINRLLSQLTDSGVRLENQDLLRIIESVNSRLFILYCGGEIAGMLTLGNYITPTGRKYWIEDVVVDTRFRGKSLGRKLVGYAIDYVSATGGGSTLMLTSNPARIAANALYKAVGLTPKDTNVYKMAFPDNGD